MKTYYEYLSVSKICDGVIYPFTKGQMRRFLFLRQKNGLQKAVRKVGKCIYIRRDLFESWIESKSEEII